MKSLLSLTCLLCLCSCSYMPWFQEVEEEIVKDLPVIIKVAEAVEEAEK